MKFKIIVFLVFVVVGLGITGAYTSRGVLLNKPLVMNSDFTPASTAKLWKEIKDLHNVLPIKEVITINLNSNGGYMIPANVLYARISDLQKQGRFFKGVVYGGCFSACGTLFALMDIRYMTSNGLYMQHLGSPFNTITELLERSRLIYDARMLGIPYNGLFYMLGMSQIVMLPRTMLKFKYIMGIVPQPEIDEI